MSYTDKEKNKEYSKAWYHKNKERLNTPERKAKRSESVRQWRNKEPLRAIFAGAKSRAKRLGQEFNIQLADLQMPECCPILGIPLYRTEGRATDNSPSLDRVDNSKGYIKGNVRVISNKANKHKSDLSLEDVQRLFEYCNSARE